MKSHRAATPLNGAVRLLLSGVIMCWLAEATAGDDAFASEPLGVLGREESGDGGDVVYLAGATEWGLRDEAIREVGADEACCVRTFGYNEAGVDGVDANLLWTQLFCEHTCDRVKSALGSGVDGAVGRGQAACARADVDDASALADVFNGGAGGKKDTEYINVEHLVEVVFGDIFNGSELIDAGVVDEDVEAAIVLDGCVDDALRFSGLGDVSADSDGFAAGCGDGGDDDVGTSLAGGIVDHDGCAFRG